MVLEIPPQPKTDDEHLEIIAKIIFTIGFNWSVVSKKWPYIKKAFNNFSITKVKSADVNKLMKAEGMIKNQRKIETIIHNANECHKIQKEHGSMKDWVKKTNKLHEKDPIFNPSLAEECQERFKGIGITTREWVDHVFSGKKHNHPSS